MVWRRRFLESKPSCLRTLDPLSVFLSVLPSCPPLLFWKVILHCWSLPLEGRDGGGQPGSTLAVALGPPPPNPAAEDQNLVLPLVTPILSQHTAGAQRS